MSTYSVTQLTSTPVTTLGEGPHWDIETQSLYFIDILRPDLPIHRYDYAENKTYSAKLVGIDNNPKVSFIIPVEGEPGKFVISLNRQLGVIEWDGKSTEAKVVRIVTTVDTEEHLAKNQINDAKVDPMGRLYFGSWQMATSADVKPLGSLYRYDKGQVTKLFDQVLIANGLAWNLEKKKFYYIDSLKINVREFDYDPSSGDISNEKVLAPLGSKDNGSGPDGMTIDKDGFLYIAIFNGSKVVKVNPSTGKIELEISIPTNQVTSVAFGGPNLDVLFVTTANFVMGEEKASAFAGTVYKITGVGVGLPMKKVTL